MTCLYINAHHLGEITQPKAFFHTQHSREGGYKQERLEPTTPSVQLPRNCGRNCQQSTWGYALAEGRGVQLRTWMGLQGCQWGQQTIAVNIKIQNYQNIYMHFLPEESLNDRNKSNISPQTLVHRSFKRKITHIILQSLIIHSISELILPTLRKGAISYWWFTAFIGTSGPLLRIDTTCCPLVYRITSTFDLLLRVSYLRSFHLKYAEQTKFQFRSWK